MIERQPESSPFLVSATVSGRLQHEDFRCLSVWIDGALAVFGKCTVLIRFHEFGGWHARALWDDLTFHTVRSLNLKRVAYVGSRRWHQFLVSLSKPVTRAEVRYFDADSLEAARAWVLGA